MERKVTEREKELGGPKKPLFRQFLGLLVKLLLCLEHRPSPVALPGLGVQLYLSLHEGASIL